MVRDMTSGSILKNIVVFSVPVAITLLCQNLFSIVDSIAVGQFVDAGALGSVACCGAIINLFMLLSYGFSLGYKVVVGQFFGAGHLQHTKQAIYTSFTIMGVMALVISLAGVALAGPMLRLQGVSKELFANAELYLTLYFAGIGMIIIRNGINNIYYALGDTKTPMYLQIAQIILHIFLDFLLLGVYKLGIVGLAVAGWVSRGVTMIPLIWILFRHIRELPKPLHFFHKQTFQRICNLALPSCLGHGGNAVQALLINRLVNSFDVYVVTGCNIADNINNFTLLLVNAVASGAGAFAAQNYGAKHIKRIKQSGRICLAINIVYSIIIYVAIRFFGTDLIHLFLSDNTDPTLYQQITNFSQDNLLILATFAFIYNIGHVYSDMLRSVNKMRITVVSSLIGVVTRIISAYSLVPLIGESAIYWSAPIAWFSYYIIPTIYFLSGRWVPHYRAIHNTRKTIPH